jgi:ATP-dependent protease Clp ATPase subunit
MYESPSRKDIDQIILDKENVLDGIQPKMVLNQSKDSKDSKPA